MSSLGDAKGSNLKKYQELQNFAQPTRKLHYISSSGGGGGEFTPLFTPPPPWWIKGQNLKSTDSWEKFLRSKFRKQFGN